jgi:hypothetical protein
MVPSSLLIYPFFPGSLFFFQVLYLLASVALFRWLFVEIYFIFLMILNVYCQRTLVGPLTFQLIFIP